MKNSRFAWFTGIAVVSAVLLSGCGSSTTTTATSTPSTTSSGSQKNSTYVIGGAPYQGASNLQKWEQKSKSNPTNVKDLLGAGVSAYLNNQPTTAIHYYEMATKVQPKNGELWNNIGNVYRNSLLNNQKAIQFYQKATTVDPKYDYGWYNWAYTLLKMNNVSAAKTVVAKAKAVLPKSDPLYKALGELVTPSTKK